MRAYSRKKSIYTRPRLRQRLKKQILNSDRYGKRGQWNARRSQLLAKEYRAAGGGYRNQGRTTEQRSLSQWTNGDCQQAYAATIRVKRQGMKDGQQFIANAPKAKQAAKKYLD